MNTLLVIEILNDRDVGVQRNCRVDAAALLRIAVHTIGRVNSAICNSEASLLR